MCVSGLLRVNPPSKAYADRRSAQAQKTRLRQWRVPPVLPGVRPGGGKQPYLIQMRDGAPFSFAGLWERWKKGKTPIETFTIITGEPNSLTSQIHDRMPVILDPVDYGAWLTASNPSIPQAMLQPFPAQLMAAFPISTKVNSVKNDTPDVIEPLRADAQSSLF
jgi:putative SOS response-associated peptidase YedK